MSAWDTYAKSAPHNGALLDFRKFNELTKRLVEKEPFQIARYNDGEWVFIFKIDPWYYQYINRSKYSVSEIEEISQKLRDVIDSRPPYYIGIDSSTLAGAGSISGHHHILKKKIEGLDIVFGEIFNAATVRFGMDALRKPLSGRWVLTVGPEYMRKLGLHNFHITVPSRSCWTVADSIKKQIEDVLLFSDYLNSQPVIVYSCSLLAKWLVDVIYHKFGDKVTQLDIGSCIDPWCGINSREWHPALAQEHNLKLTRQRHHDSD